VTKNTNWTNFLPKSIEILKKLVYNQFINNMMNIMGYSLCIRRKKFFLNGGEL